jgi:GPH family glycoside/pentoside/hexuronide:cation symporter
MNKQEASGGLSFMRKVLYCQGCLGQNIINLAVVTWVIYFFAPPEGAGISLVPVGVAGVLMGIGRFLDVLSDPLVGYWSDNATYASGRRKPFIFWGAPLTAITFFLIWMPPVGHESVWNAVWLFLVVNGYFTALTIAGVPYRSVIPDIASTSKERLAISMGMALFGSVGALMGAGMTGPVIQSFGYVPMGLILGVIGWASLWLALKGVKERPRSAEDLATGLSIFGAVKETLKNREFLSFAASIFSFQVGFQMFMIIIPYFVKVVLGRPEAQVAIFQGSFVVVMMASLPLWLWAGNKIGKRKGQLLSLLLVALLFPFFYFIGFLPLVDPFYQALLYFCIVAIPVSGLYVFPNAIVGDITDYDEKITKKRREAMYYGGFGFVEKSAWAASAMLVGLLLDKFGYSADNPMGIRMVGPLVGFIALLGFLAFRKYTLPDSAEAPGESLSARG